jgi:hypothetical protein
MDDSIHDFTSIIVNHRIVLSVEQEHSCWVVTKVFSNFTIAQSYHGPSPW